MKLSIQSGICLVLVLGLACATVGCRTEVPPPATPTEPQFSIRMAREETPVDPAVRRQYQPYVLFTGDGRELLWVNRNIELGVECVQEVLSQKPANSTRESIEAFNKQTGITMNEKEMQEALNSVEIVIRLTPEGIDRFKNLISTNAGQRVAIIAYDKILLAPKMMEATTGKELVVSGRISPEEADVIVSRICSALAVKSVVIPGKN